MDLSFYNKAIFKISTLVFFLNAFGSWIFMQCKFKSLQYPFSFSDLAKLCIIYMICLQL